MKNVLKFNVSKFIIIGKINGLSIVSKKARINILKSLKFEKDIYHLLERKRIVGINIRHHLLAYAFLKGKPYSKLERSCRPDNKPNAKSIFEIISIHAPKFVPYDPVLKTGLGTYNPSLDDVKAWLAGELS